MTQELKNETITAQPVPVQLIYADRVTNFAFGPVISRLTLATEVAPNTFMASGTLVIPTTALVDALDFLQKTIHENDELKETVKIGLNAIKEQFDKL